MLLASFEVSHHSITLQEPLRVAFENAIRDVENLSQHSFRQIYPLFVIDATMGNSSFLNYGSYKKLFELTNTDDLSLIALEEMWFRINYKELSKDQRENENILWIKKKILKKMKQLGVIDHLVNIPLNKCKLLENNEEQQEGEDN